MIESQSRYINGLIKLVLDARRQGKTLSLRPRHDKTETYNKKVQEVLKDTSFADPACNSWYKNDEGVITNNWCGTVVEYQEMMSKVVYDDFEAEGSGQALIKQHPVQKVGRVFEGSQVSDTTLMALGLVSTAALVGGFLLRDTKYLDAI